MFLRPNDRYSLPVVHVLDDGDRHVYDPERVDRWLSDPMAEHQGRIVFDLSAVWEISGDVIHAMLRSQEVNFASDRPATLVVASAPERVFLRMQTLLYGHYLVGVESIDDGIAFFEQQAPPVPTQLELEEGADPILNISDPDRVAGGGRQLTQWLARRMTVLGNGRLIFDLRGLPFVDEGFYLVARAALSQAKRMEPPFEDVRVVVVVSEETPELHPEIEKVNRFVPVVGELDAARSYLENQPYRRMRFS